LILCSCHRGRTKHPVHPVNPVKKIALDLHAQGDGILPVRLPAGRQNILTILEILSENFNMIYKALIKV